MNAGRLTVCACLALAIVTAMAVRCAATVGDDRFAMSGWRGWTKFDEVGSCWFLNWGRSLSSTYVSDDYPYLRMYWRTKADEYTDETIQGWARTAKSMYGPGATVWWTASNEPNDRGQANQTPAEFAAGYYQYYRNLKIGDPTCKVLGPGILNWTFQSDSVWQKGKEWYEELRQLWANDPTYSAYSTSIQGNPYPPMDGFNMHTYDLRGAQGTPYVGPPDWKYLKSETLACYADLQTYPETQGLKIWNTEYSSLRAGNITDSADTLGGIGLWFRQQPFMARWFFFILDTSDGSWQQTVLLDPSDNVNPLGKAHYTLSTMGDAEVYNMPFNAAYDSGASYTRPGSVFTTRFSEDYSLGLNIFPQQGQSYTAGEMRGRAYTTSRRIRRVTFNYRTTCDPALFRLEVDVPGQTPVWTSGADTLDQWADIDLSAYDVNQVSFGVYCIADNTYSDATRAAKVQVNNITFWFDDTVEAAPYQAKSILDRRRVRMSNVVVSAVYPDAFAVQSEDRCSGILVNGAAAVEVGDRCAIEGDTSTVNGARVLVNPAVISRAAGGAPDPLGVINRSSGGGTFGLQEAVIDDAAAGKHAVGLSNVGLLVRTCGRVTYVDESAPCFYVDDGSGLSDGSGHPGLRVSLKGLPVPVPGTQAMVTGLSSTAVPHGEVVRLILPRGPEDVQFGEVSTLLANGGFEYGDISGWSVVGSSGLARTGTWYFTIAAHGGDWFYGHGSNWGANPGMLYQRVSVDPGQVYYLSAWSRVLHGGNEEQAAMNRIGVDPTGGTDPESASVIWSAWDSQPATYISVWRQLSLTGIQPSGTRLTVYLHTYQQNEANWHINCFDDVLLRPSGQ